GDPGARDLRGGRLASRGARREPAAPPDPARALGGLLPAGGRASRIRAAHGHPGVREAARPRVRRPGLEAGPFHRVPDAHGPGGRVTAAGSAGPRATGRHGRLGELARLFLKLGVIAFGGPAAHIAMMEDEVVTRRRWIDRQHFLDLIGATNLIPGPNSTEMTMHVGYERAGWPGLFTAGGCFILPAVLITGVFGWLYVTYGSLPEVEPFLYGIKPAVIAVILGAVWKLGKKAVKGWRFAVMGLAAAAAVLAGVGEIWALLAGGLLGTFWLRLTGYDSCGTASRWVPILLLQQARDTTGAAAAAGVAGVAAGVSLWKLFFFF